MFQFEELDEVTRRWMLEEFLAEETSGRPYRSTRLTPAGLAAYPKVMEQAIRSGNEETLAQALADPTYWKAAEVRAGSRRPHVADTAWNAYQTLAYGEFSTWYIRGLARRLKEEGETQCQVYRAAPAGQVRNECTHNEGQIFSLAEVYAGHRARYWPPETKDPRAFSIPAGPNCHHSIRRIRQ